MKPIVPRKGPPIVSLSDARKYLLSQTEQDPAFEAAAEAVLMAAEGRGPLLHAQVGMSRLVYGPVPIPQPTGKRSWNGKRSK